MAAGLFYSALSAFDSLIPSTWSVCWRWGGLCCYQAMEPTPECSQACSHCPSRDWYASPTSSSCLPAPSFAQFVGAAAANSTACWRRARRCLSRSLACRQKSCASLRYCEHWHGSRFFFRCFDLLNWGHQAACLWFQCLSSATSSKKRTAMGCSDQCSQNCHWFPPLWGSFGSSQPTRPLPLDIFRHQSRLFPWFIQWISLDSTMCWGGLSYLELMDCRPGYRGADLKNAVSRCRFRNYCLADFGCESNLFTGVTFGEMDANWGPCSCSLLTQ